MEYTVLVNSCDSYSDLWEPFFKLLRLHWPDVNENRIMLNTETKMYSIDGIDLQRPHLTEEDVTTWSKRFKACLNQIDTKYVVILLDDFFLEEDVDTQRLNKCIEAMERDDSVRCFTFVPTLWPNKDDGAFENFELRGRKAPYLLNLQAGLWRTEELKSLVRENETPWEFEEWGTHRAAKAGGKYYVAKEGCPQVFTYNWKPGGAVHRGKWTTGVDELLKEIDVDMDFSIRGWDVDRPKVKVQKTMRQKVSDFIWPVVAPIKIEYLYRKYHK